jgi:hypothetical protein
MTPLLAFLIVIVVLVIVYRLWSGRKTEPAASTQKKKPDLVSKTIDWIENGGSIPASGRQAVLPQQFRNWVTEALGKEKDLQAWLLSLPEEGAHTLVEHLADFCSGLGLRLFWLVTGSLEQEPDLAQVMEDIVVAYCSACRKAVLVQEQAQTFRTLQAVQNDPFGKEQRDLSRKLYAELINEGMAESPPELFLASEEKRQAHITQAIRQAARADRKTFKTILETALAQEER